MPTPKKGARLGGSAKQQAHMLSNLAASLIEHGAIKTTDAKAKVLRPYIEKIITKAKSGTVADRRAVLKLIPRKDVVSYLFDEVAPKFENVRVATPAPSSWTTAPVTMPRCPRSPSFLRRP